MVKTRWTSRSSTTEEDTASSSSVQQRARWKRKTEEEGSDGSSEDSPMSLFITKSSIERMKTEQDTSSESSSSVKHREYRNRKSEKEDSDSSLLLRKKGRRLKAEEDTSSASSSSSQDEKIFLKLARKRKAEEEDSDSVFVKPTSSNIPQQPQGRATKKRRMEPTTSSGPSTSVQDSSGSRSRRRKDEEEAPRPRTKRARNPDAVRSPRRTTWRLRRRPVEVINPEDHPVLALKGSSMKVFHNKYLKQEKIGHGGFGTVFAGLRKSDNLPVAIKYVKKATALSSTVVGLSGRHYTTPTEVVLLLRAGGDSSCVGQNASVSLIEWFDFENTIIIVMERPQNSLNLLDLVTCYTGPLPENEAKMLIREVICATMEVMRKDVFHRDLKCSNILVQECPDVDCGYKVRIVDFGCGSDVEALYEGMYVGTIEYAPPEYCAEGWYRAEPTCVWQLGAVLFNLVDPQGKFSTMDLIERKPKFKRGLSKDCRHFLNSCLKLMPTERLPLNQLLCHPWF